MKQFLAYLKLVGEMTAHCFVKGEEVHALFQAANTIVIVVVGLSLYEQYLGHKLVQNLGALYLAFLLLMYAPYRVWKKAKDAIIEPKIVLDFGPDVVGCIKDHRPPHENYRHILSVNILVKSTATVHGCIGSLLSIDKLIDGKWVRQRAFAGSQTLNWHYYGIGKLQVPTNPGDERFLHVLFIRESDGGVELTTHAADVPALALVNTPNSVMAFHISVAGDEAPPAHITFRFEKGDTWDKPRVSKI